MKMISKVSPSDLDVLREISISTFVDTFAADNTEDNMQAYLSKAFSPEKIMQEIQDPDAEICIAWDGDVAAGYLKVNFGSSQTEFPDGDAMEIERIYVRNEFKGKSLGRLLMDHALHIAAERKASFVWLGVWERNQRAIRFYEKQGFVPFDSHIFMLGDDAQRDILMKRPVTL